jgi:hypothetical protein
MLLAQTPDGGRLPVLDLSLPEFSVPHSDAEIEAIAAAALAEERGRGPLQRFVLRFVMRSIARQSRLVAALQAANSGYLSGIPTYVLKLGSANLVPPYDSDIDKRVAETPIVRSLRVRLAQVAELLADGLAPLLAGNGRPLTIIEIAGGPSADALNALLMLEKCGCLAGRTARIAVYDLDSDGPAFAENMLDALKTGPLAGRDVELAHISGNWSDVGGLERVIEAIPADAIVAATSEGGLFEYGSDEDIAGVLRALAPRAPIVTGSVTGNGEINMLMRRHSSANTRPRGLERFAALIAPSGYRIAESKRAVLSDQVLLTRPS